MARSASTTAYAATMAELASYASAAYVPNYFTGTPSMDSVGAPGTAAFVARGDHVHPSDTTRYAASNPSGYQTAAQVATAVAPAFNGVGRNLLHNPLFNVAQRGAGPWTVSAFTLDRWMLLLGLDTVSVVQTALTVAAVAPDEQAAYCLTNTFTGNAGAAAFTLVRQAIEDVRRLANKTFTVSFWAAAQAGTPKLGISFDQYFGSGGSPSATVSTNGQSVTLSNSWTRYSLTFTAATIAGKTLGTSNDHVTYINFWYSAGSTQGVRSGNVGVQSAQVYLWGVQLEIGSVATPLEKPDPRYDLANCQRFFTQLLVGSYGYGLASASLGGIVTLPVTMRAIPAPVIVNSTGSSNSGGYTSAGSSAGTVYFYGLCTATGSSSVQLLLNVSADL